MLARLFVFRGCGIYAGGGSMGIVVGKGGGIVRSGGSEAVGSVLDLASFWSNSMSGYW